MTASVAVYTQLQEKYNRRHLYTYSRLNMQQRFVSVVDYMGTNSYTYSTINHYIQVMGRHYTQNITNKLQKRREIHLFIEVWLANCIQCVNPIGFSLEKVLKSITSPRVLGNALNDHGL